MLALICFFLLFLLPFPSFGSCEAQFRQILNIQDMYRQQASEGDKDALFRLGLILKKTNKGKAMEAFNQASQQGHLEAKFEMGLLHEAMVHYHNDHQALSIYTQLANMGHLPSQLRLGRLFFYGNNTFPQNLGQSFKWFERAADQGSPEAYEQMAKMYRQGLFVEQNKERSIELIQKAKELRGAQTQAPKQVRSKRAKLRVL